MYTYTYPLKYTAFLYSLLAPAACNRNTAVMATLVK